MRTPIYTGIFQSDLEAAGYKITGLPTPLDSDEAATKGYVDDHAGGGGGGGGSDVTITVNVKDAPYSAAGDGLTDDTVAIQSAINDVWGLGGGVVFFPKGVYLCNGSFDATTNSILKFPYCLITLAGAIAPVPIELRGEAPAMAAATVTGSVIKSTKTGTGTAPSVLAAYGYLGRTIAGDYYNDFSYVQAVIRNLTFDTTGSATIDAIRLDTATMAIVEDVVIIGVGNNTTAPTAGTVGIWMPGTQNFATNFCNRVWVFGFDTGMVASSEHFRCPQFNAMNCALGCEFLSGGELGWANLMVYQCPAAVKFTSIDGTANRCPMVLNLQVEYVSSGWQARGTYDIIDTSGSGSGELRYYMWGGTGSSVLSVNGGTNLRLINTNTARDIVTRSTTMSASLVSALPASPVVGQMACVGDGQASLAWGATVTGGGATKYLVWYNGTNWVVIGPETNDSTPVYIGTDARLVAVSGGVKLEARNTGTGTWIEAARWTNP